MSGAFMSKKIESLEIVVGENKLSGSIWSDIDASYIRSYLLRNVDNSANIFLEQLEKQGKLSDTINTCKVIDLNLLLSTINGIKKYEIKDSLNEHIEILKKKCINKTCGLFKKENFVASRYSSEENHIYIYTKNIKDFKSWLITGEYPASLIENNSITAGGIQLNDIVSQTFKIGFGKATYAEANTNQSSVFINLPELIKAQVYFISESFYNPLKFSERLGETNDFFKNAFLNQDESKIKRPKIKL